MGTPAVAKLVMHEIHRPHLVQRLLHLPGLGFLTHHALLGLGPQVQFEAPIDAVDPLVIPSVALHVSEIQEPKPEQPIAIVLFEANQPVGDLGAIRLQLGLVAIVTLTGLARRTGHSDRHRLLGDRSSSHLTPLTWHHDFFVWPPRGKP